MGLRREGVDGSRPSEGTTTAPHMGFSGAWPASWPTGVALQLHITEGDEDHEIAQTLAATVPNAELFVDRRRGALLHRRAVDFLQALVGDEFRAARRSHTLETTGRCVVHRRVRDERAASAI